MIGMQQTTYDFSKMQDGQVLHVMEELRTGLTVEEARKLQSSILKRPPTMAELILFGIEGSEHCSYKSSRMYLKQFVTEGPDVIIGAKEDAGIVRVAKDASGKGYAIVLSHESHNHPSQLVPYEGAATGVGGNVRDVCCMGAKVIALADDLRFGDISIPHNKWLYEGVVAGIGGYGNPIGVPNLAGGLQFDPLYNGNCLVTVVTLGLVEESAIIHSHAPEHADGYDLILVGKSTDSSGFGGASFASFQLDDSKAHISKGAVQEPNAFLGRHIIKSSTELFKRLQEMNAIDRVGFKDLGAGGIACASVELAESGGYGAVIHLDEVHTADPAIPAQVILCAETQERYLWASPPDLTPLILAHYNEIFALPAVSHGAEARVIGKITTQTDYIVYSGGEIIVNAPAAEVTKGFLYERPLGNLALRPKEPLIAPLVSPNDIFRQLLGHENIASRKPLYETYDKQVQGSTVLEAGEGNSGVLCPFNEVAYPPEIRSIGITLTTDQNPRQNRIDPYQGAVNAVAEAYCNTIATGATPIALSDCLCYGNPEKPDQMRQFAEGCKGVANAASFLGVPVIAGNVSLYNESETGSIAPSPMIAMVGKLSNYNHAITPAFKGLGSDILMLGERKDECGGSVFYSLFEKLGANLPEPDLGLLIKIAGLLSFAAENDLVQACHDISEGGVAIAIAEMAMASGMGCSVIIPGDLPVEKLLFSESFGFILETSSLNTKTIIDLCTQKQIPCHRIGKTLGNIIELNNGYISISVEEATKYWENGLRDSIG
jgi:phosphoribosylformylglycinamidine synthase subunit PurL